MIENQLKGRTLDKTLKEDGGIWMIDRNGNKVNKIRHIRCFSDDVTNPLPIKTQTNKSTKDYKNQYWAKSGENYLCVIYQNIKKDKKGNEVLKEGRVVLEREIEIVNLMEVAIRRKSSLDDDLGIYRKDKKGVEIISENGTKEVPFAILKKGTKVIFYKECIEELKELSMPELNKRIYKVKKFAGSRITFDYHLEAREDSVLIKKFDKTRLFKCDEKGAEILFGSRGVDGFSENFFDYVKLNNGNPWHRLRYSREQFNFAIEGKHFEIEIDGQINWKGE
jgi:CRISPR-associated endonuclease Csn1